MESQAKDKTKNPTENSVKLSVYENLDLEKILKSFSNIKSPEQFKFQIQKLKEKCSDKNLAVSQAALQALYCLGETGVLTVNHCISLFVSLVPSMNGHYSGLINAIGKILLRNPGATVPHVSQYPIVTVLRHDWALAWPAAYHFLLKVLFDEKSLDICKKIECIRPLCFYIFCGIPPTALSKIQTLQALIKFWDYSEMKLFIFEMLSFQKTDIDFCWLILELFTIRNDDDVPLLECSALILGKCVKWLIENGHDPTLWISLLEKHIKVTELSHSALLILLADTYRHCSAANIEVITLLCKDILKLERCNSLSGYYLFSILLQWSIFPSILTKNLPNHISDISSQLILNKNKKLTKDLFKNVYLNALKNSHSDIIIAIERAHMLDKGNALTGWIKEMAISSRSHIDFHNIISCLVLTLSDAESVCKGLTMLTENAQENRQLGFSVLCLLLFKLSRERNPKMQLIYLKYVIEMAVDKDNISIIIGTLESLRNGNPIVMETLVLSFYLKLWKLEKRTFPQLFQTLVGSKCGADNFWEVQVAKSLTMLEICRARPELHGKDLVAPLSDILNNCGSLDSGLPSALAIEAIGELCKEKVVDVAGTWKALEPKLGRDMRVEVVKSLCRLFQLVPKLNDSTAFYEIIIERLWMYARDKNIGTFAFEALGEFPLDYFTLKLMPDCCKVNLKMPEEFIKTAADAALDPELVLPYVPGECWSNLFDSLPPELINGYTIMLKKLLAREILNLPRGIYHLPEETAEPKDYRVLPYKSILRGIVDFLISQSKNSSPNKRKIQTLMKVLSEDYKRLLPPLNWSFLESENFKDAELNVVQIWAQQGSSSISAKTLVDNYVQKVTSSAEVSKIMHLYSILSKISCAIPSNTLRLFTDKTVNDIVKSAIDDSQDAMDNFKIIMSAIKATIGLANVSESNRTTLILIVESLMTVIPADHKIIDDYAGCVSEFPEKYLARMTSPATWWATTSELLKISIRIRSVLALHSDTLQPMMCLNDCIDAAATLPSEYEWTLHAIGTLLLKCRNHSSSKQWLMELRGRIQVTLNDDVTATTFFLRLYILSAVILSGYDSFTTFDELVGHNQLQFRLFPASLLKIYSHPDWNIAQPQVIEWLHRIRKCNDLPKDFKIVFYEALLMFKESQYLQEFVNNSRLLYNW